jgi:PAS domain S-box-containing protein
VDGIVVIDAHGRIEAFNPAAVRLFGYEEHEVVGRNVNMLMPSPYHEEHDTYLARHLATGVQKIIGTGREVMGLRRDGTTFPLHVSVGKMTAGGEPRFTGILHDLSARVPDREATARTDVAGEARGNGGRDSPRGEESAGRRAWRDSDYRHAAAEGQQGRPGSWGKSSRGSIRSMSS